MTRRGLSWMAAIALAAGGCGDDAGSGPSTGPGRLTVTVVVEGWPQADVEVTAVQGFGVASARTDSAGRAHLSGLETGTWTLDLAGLDIDARMPDLPDVQIVDERTVEVTVEGTWDRGRFSAVSPSGVYACGLNENGNAYCWGLGENGELGNGEFGLKGVLTRVRAPERLTQVVTGFFHACGLGASGAAYCWGSNASGRLGRGLGVDELGRSSVPGRVEGNLQFSQLAAGRSATCGLERGGGRAWCWGSSAGGFLGSAGGSASAPRLVAGSRRFVALASRDAWGGNGAIAGRTAEGAVWAWGGQIEGVTPWSAFDADEPVEVPLPEPAVAHTSLCARAAGGNRYCWPDLSGSVPSEVTAQFEATAHPLVHRYLPPDLDLLFFDAGMPCRPQAATFVCLVDWFQETPALSFAGEPLRAVATVGYAGCAVTQPGRLWCWDPVDFQANVIAGPGT